MTITNDSAEESPTVEKDSRINVNKIRSEKATKVQEETHPCLKEQKQSMKCLEDNHYDKTQCTLTYKNYKACMDFWGSVKLERRRNGIVPYLPPVEEREEIKKKKLGLL